MPGVWNTLIPITIFCGGEVFVQDGRGQDRLLPYEVTGTKIPVVAPFVSVDGSLPHATCGWRGNRVVVVAYHARDPERWPPSCVDLLTGFGFQIKL